MEMIAIDFKFIFCFLATPLGICISAEEETAHHAGEQNTFIEWTK